MTRSKAGDLARAPVRSATRLAVFASHPIQYQAPLWRGLSARDDVDLVVYYLSDHSIRGGTDEGFGVSVSWDVPVLEGYESVFLARDADLSRPGSVGLPCDPGVLLREGRFDAVFVNGYTHRFEWQVLRAARQLGIGTLIRGEFTDVLRPGHTLVRRIARDLYLRWIYRSIDAFCVVGRDAERHLERFGIPIDRRFASPYCVDSEHFEAQGAALDRATCRAELGLRNEDRVLLFSGKFIPRKAPQLLVEAAARLGDERVVVILLGSGELEPSLREFGKRTLGTRLRMPGFVNQNALGRYFRAADLFVLPSRFETWGLVVNEAMHFGLPVVASSKVGSTRDLVIDGETGFVFEDGSVDDLACRLAAALQDPAALARMGRAAHMRIQSYSSRRAVEGIAAAARASAR